MAEENVLEVRRMTVDEVKQNPPLLDKKFILINSSLYTDEAYEYLLELVNETDSIAFIRDLRKIYTHGEYFGGDLWEDSLFYFGDFQILSEDDELKVSIEAEEQKEALRLKGINNLNITAEEEYINGEKLKTIIFDYDVSNVVNTSVIKIDDSTAEYNLEVVNGQIQVNKYIPIRVEQTTELSIIEYDSDITSIDIPIDIYGTDNNKTIYVTASSNDNVEYNSNTGIITSEIQYTTNDIDYLVLYSDSNIQNSLTITQKFGFANVYDTEEIMLATFFSCPRYLSGSTCDGEIILDIDEGKYGWFACPEWLNPIFIDEETNISGGWVINKQFKLYTLEITYNVYRTEQSGLGFTRWTVKNFMKN